MQPPQPPPPLNKPEKMKWDGGTIAVAALIGVVGLLVVVAVVVFATGGFDKGDSRWTAECNERAANAYNFGHPYSEKEIAKACVDRAEEIEGTGASDSEVREILDEFGKTNQ